MGRRRSTLRAGALIAASALALHELRYLIGYGDASGQALSGQGHSYIPAAGALVAFALALAAAQLVTMLVRGGPQRRPAPLWLSWSLATVALLCVYTGQELAEGLFASGHPSGLDAVVANGGLVAVPLAMGFGLLVALVMRGAHAALVAVARRRGAVVPRPGRRLGVARPTAAPSRVRSSIIARNLAGRAPPVAA